MRSASIVSLAGPAMSRLRPAAEQSPVDGAPPRPAGTALSRGMALAFGQQGLAAIHACLIDAGSMACQSGWSITRNGGMRDAVHDPDFVRAMATIVHLNPPAGRETVVRQLSPLRWAFGWHLDERQMVVVAQAQYRTACEAPSDIDKALVRMLCDACIGVDRRAAAPDDAMAGPPGAANDPARPAVGAARRSKKRRPAGAEAPALRQVRRRALLVGLCAFVLGLQGLWYLQWRRSEALTFETQRLQALSEATLAQSIASALARGDHGVLQAELDRFQALRYFDAALVANARGQVVSKSNTARGVRLGEVPEPKSIAGSRSVELRNGAAQALGQLLVWSYRGTP